MPSLKCGKKLSTDTVEKVINFYESDTNSRMMSNKKDAVIIRNDGRKQKVQKCLLLSDVCILHKQFKKLYPEHSMFQQVC